MSNDVDQYQDILDSRDIIARIQELNEEREALADAVNDCRNDVGAAESGSSVLNARQAHADLDKAEAELAQWDVDWSEELNTLTTLEAEAEGCGDWKHGETLIRDSYFERYTEQVADDMGLLQWANSWPCTCIDWERAARELQMDYTSVDFAGVTYWIQS